jgi:hypothetical protein
MEAERKIDKIGFQMMAKKNELSMKIRELGMCHIFTKNMKEEVDNLYHSL